ncbi:sulfurtransferase TusA family protein [bacterium]|nr:sulfurtransferase TusA family protein [bacterium]
MGCGSLMIALRRAILPLAPGTVMKVRALDPGAPEDIPAWCRLTGHTLLFGPDPQRPGCYLIRRKVEQ